MYQNILLAVDGSDNALRAAKHAVHLSKVSGAQVDVINMIDYDEARSEMIQTKDSELDKLRKERYQPAVDVLKENGIEHEVFVFYGNPGLGIVEHANENAYDLVLMGSRGLNRLQEMFLGSVSQKVVQRANCPVLIVK